MKKNKLILIIFLLLFSLTLFGCSSGQFEVKTQYMEKTMYTGERIMLQTNINELDGNTVVWESSDENVVVVDQKGLVMALAEGNVNITATLGEYSCIIFIRVFEKEAEDIIDVQIEGKQTVLIDETINLTAKASNNSKVFVWSSSDDTIATVDQTGMVKGLKPGVVTIKASLSENNKVYGEIIVLVRTGDGIQDIINNYINNNSYVTSGDYDLTSINETVVNMVKEVEDSVIGVSAYANVEGTQNISTGTGGIYKKETLGNGFKYTVFTNHHVIEESKSVKVYLGDIDEYVFATIVKSDAELDLAVLTFEHTKEYEPLKLGEVGCVANGDFVVAIGNPSGYTYYGSVTFGMISYVSREMDGVIYVQHDTPINPGNSGGPLFDLNGNVIGINTLKIVSTSIEGLGFSIGMEVFLEYLQ